MKHLISPLDLSVEELDQLLDLAQDIEANPKKYAHACDGKKLATLFYEPSTRTRLSHEAAMLNLGGSVMGFSSADSSSASKGESVSEPVSAKVRATPALSSASARAVPPPATAAAPFTVTPVPWAHGTQKCPAMDGRARCYAPWTAHKSRFRRA